MNLVNPSERWEFIRISTTQTAEAAILEERKPHGTRNSRYTRSAFTGILAQVGAAKQVLMDDLEATGAHLDLIKELARTGLIEARRSVVALRPQLLEEAVYRAPYIVSPTQNCRNGYHFIL